jgi:predicted dehydrogenase
MLFDYPYAPSQIAALLGPCKSVSAMAKISVPKRRIVPDSEYDKFLEGVTNPDEANYWPVVLNLPKTQEVQMEAEDNVFCLYEMADGTIGVFHVGRLFHPTLPGTGYGALQIFGTEGNLVCGGGHMASLISTKKDLLPRIDKDGWYHIAMRGDPHRAVWPQPVPGGFNYYHESSKHFVECIIEDRDPVVGIDWGLHITEMMCGAIQSARSGKRYEMTTTVKW